MFDAAPALLPFITADKLRPLAAASAAAPSVSCRRYRPLPSSAIRAWTSRSGTDRGTRRHAAADRATAQRRAGEDAREPDIRDSFTKQGADPAGGSPEQFAAFMREEHARWGVVVKEAGIKPD